MTATLERLRDLLHRDFGIAREALEPGATLESLDIDSLRLIEIVFCVEEEFGISVPADSSELKTRLATFGDLAAYIDELSAAAPRSAP
ncbi:MAG TPA: phosphopantetheine-binding protein [Usitatibacter sp.]|nr:phosphopantetheine-binding protein [Usitatibacter sp.]